MVNQTEEKDNKVGIVDLFPYKIKNRKAFLRTDHPVNLHPESEAFEDYWMARLKEYIEGEWINDNGTWVFFPPKLNYYVNYLFIEDDERNPIHPWLRDVEWITFSYLLCVDGFSGFMNDDEYTCNVLVKQYNDGTINEVDVKRLDKHCRKPDGSLKEYINAWTYLTRHYLIDSPAEHPLGLPLYENNPYNGQIFSGRGVGKSLCVFVGDFCHEWCFSGVKYMEDIDKVNRRYLFAMACGDARPLSRSIKNVESALTKMPGNYRFPVTNGKTIPPYMGPFYKQTQGSWRMQSEVNHVVKRADNTTEILGSSVQTMVLDIGRTKVAAGDRFRRIYLEEAGFLKNLIDIHKANKDSLRVGRRRVGSSIMTGTGGDMEAIRQPKRMFESPAAYDIFGIPNYWENEEAEIGLFIPTYYKYEDFRDENGNTDLEQAFKFVLEERDKLAKEADTVTYDSEIMFNPVEPQEMLRPGGNNVLPKQEAADQLAKVRSMDLFKKKAMIGELRYDPTEKCGVRFDKDLTNKMAPILDYDMGNMLNKEGAFIMYEQPVNHRPKDLYWVVYDPAAQDGTEGSMHSVLVYKYFYSGNENTWYDTIVAEWIGRYDTLDKNYDMVIRIAKFFNAKIFPEVNVPGFVLWARKNNFTSMLEADALDLERSIHKNAAKNRYSVGVNMNKRKKEWALHKLRDWLMEVKETDPNTGIPTVRTMDWVVSPRILDEILSFNTNGNFDHISSLCCLMILLNKLEGRDHVNINEYEEEDYFGIASDSQIMQTTYTRKKRCKLLQY